VIVPKKVDLVGKKLNHIPQKCFFFLQKCWQFVFKTHKSIGLIEEWGSLLIIYMFGLKREDEKGRNLIANMFGSQAGERGEGW
jgi:hypothetical protein